MKKILGILTIGYLGFGLDALNISLERASSSVESKAPIVISVENNCNQKKQVKTAIFEKRGDGTVRSANKLFSIIGEIISVAPGDTQQIKFFPHLEDNDLHEFEIAVTDSAGKKKCFPFTVTPPPRKALKFKGIKKDKNGFLRAKVLVAK